MGDIINRETGNYQCPPPITLEVCGKTIYELNKISA